MITKYHCPDSCNKCGGMNNEQLCLGSVFSADHSGETKTICKDCGHEDYWAHGFFLSSEYMESKAKTYSFKDQ